MKKKCKRCGREFEAIRRDVECCSTLCRLTLFKNRPAERKGVERICPECGKTFLHNGTRKIYCGKECAYGAKKRGERERERMSKL